MRIRPCIDLHQGKVKQIVGSTLTDSGKGPRENFVAEKPPSFYSRLFKEHNLVGGHIIMLGPGNEEAAIDALKGWPNGMQIGGGINLDNALFWLKKGATHVIVTSFCFYDGVLDWDRLKALSSTVGKNRLVLDLSCRKRNGKYFIVTDRWQKFTKVFIERDVLLSLSKYCDEFLVHGVDVEGKCQGVDEELIELLSDITPIPTTYAGGAKSIDDAYLVLEKGKGKLDLTIGSALDIFGGRGVRFEEIVEFNKKFAH